MVKYYRYRYEACDLTEMSRPEYDLRMLMVTTIYGKHARSAHLDSFMSASIEVYELGANDRLAIVLSGNPPPITIIWTPETRRPVAIFSQMHEGSGKTRAKLGKEQNEVVGRFVEHHLDQSPQVHVEPFLTRDGVPVNVGDEVYYELPSGKFEKRRILNILSKYIVQFDIPTSNNFIGARWNLVYAKMPEVRCDSQARALLGHSLDQQPKNTPKK